VVESGTGAAGPGTGVARIRVREEHGIRRRAEPATVGVPLPRGAVRDPSRLALTDAAGRSLPLQTEILDRWSDTSVRWLLLDFALDVDARAETLLTLGEAAPGGTRPHASPHALELRDTPSGVFVDTGPVHFALAPGTAFPFRSVRSGGVELLERNSALRCRDGHGRTWTARTDRLEVETAGPLRATVRLDGALHHGTDAPPLRTVARASFFAGSATSRVEITVHNPRRAAHPGGHWELGDAGSFLFDDLSLELRLRSADRVAWSADASTPLAEAGAVRFELYQDSSGGEHWNSRVHRTRDGSVGPSFPGYRVVVDGVERSGRRASPRVALHDGKSGASVSLRHFWQNFPKAVEANGAELALRLFPPQCRTPHELQGGEARTHEIALTFGADARGEAADAFRHPLRVLPDPATLVASGALPYVVPEADDPSPRYVRLVRQAVDGDDTFERKRERVDEYGWRNFGDTWADHEAAGHDGPGEFVSHHNNQYDVLWGAILQYARSGDTRWHDIADSLASHVADVDRYQTTEDKPAYNGGLFWHTVHHVDAGLSTHRSYPKRGSRGGGPDNEHNYTTGLTHAYYLTGRRLFRDAARAGADWVIRADDPDGTILRWLDRSPTGLASKTRHFHYHGPGRGAGNSIQALLDAWRLTREGKYLEKCEELVRRTIHPEDDIDARALLDAENRWSYTVHLQALGRYLDEMAEAGRLDETYSYARESLLAYARWMRDRERPALDEPDRLEHPSETWAAQELRKTDVLLFAALHSRGAERERFLEASERFFEPSLERLESFTTKSTLRPVVLLMRNGLMRSWFRAHPDAVRPEGPTGVDFGEPRKFVPQKLRAIAKARRIAVGAGAAAVLAAAALLLR